MLRRRLTSRPAAFTLVELLVVIAIIIILLGLLLPAVQKVRILGMETEARNEMSQFTNAATNFKNDWGQTPPTVFRLPTMPGGNANPIEEASWLFLKQRYPRWNPPLLGANINWNDTAQLPGMAPFVGQTLQGNQSMVFFLGGPQLTGWAIDRPSAPSTAAISKSFYLEVNQSKLQPGSQYGYPSNANVYVDPFGSAYLYWGSNHPAKGGKYTGVAQPALATVHPDLGATGTVNAYLESPTKYTNENMCQIISAGPNNRFGSGGGNWSPTNAEYVGSGLGGDDMANFNNGNRLGVK